MRPPITNKIPTCMPFSHAWMRVSSTTPNSSCTMARCQRSRLAVSCPTTRSERRAAPALVLVDGAQFCPFLFRLMLNLIALGGDALVKHLPGGPCRKIASQGHRDPVGQHLTQHDQE